MFIAPSQTLWTCVGYLRQNRQVCFVLDVYDTRTSPLVFEGVINVSCVCPCDGV